MVCKRYGSASVCLIFAIVPSVVGTILILLTWLQWYRRREAEINQRQRVGLILDQQIGLLDQQDIENQQQIPVQQRVGKKFIHWTVFKCSPIYMIGWLLDSNMKTAIELLIAYIFIDMVTISLAYILWNITLEKLKSWYYAMKGDVAGKSVGLAIDVMYYISIAWILVNNFIEFYLDSLWPRAFFYYWLAFIFAFGIVLLTSLVVILTLRVQSLPNEQSLWALVILVFVIGAVAIWSQIADGTARFHDRDRPFYAQLPEDAVTFSIIFMAIQGGMLLAGVWYAWI